MSDAAKTHMARALALARATVARASPNPQVGCVLTHNEKIVGEGAHLYDQRDHAEIVALNQAGPQARGATAYVTLEPCSHQGRTPPCADALIAAGVSRCFVATEDPNPQVSGRGIQKLRKAGIEVHLGLLQPQARELNDAFAHFIQTGRPFVTLKAALSADGKLAPPPAQLTGTQPFWLTGPAARAQVQQLRHASDAILTGIGTVLADNPALTDRSGPDRTALLRRRPLLRVILDTQLRTPLNSQLILSAQSDLLLIHSPAAPRPRRKALEALDIELLAVPEHNGQLSLPAVLATLAGRHITSLLLETGSTLNAAFLRQHLVDRVVLFYAERELGPHALPFAANYDTPFALEQRLTRLRKETLPPDILVSGLLHDPWQSLNKEVI